MALSLKSHVSLLLLLCGRLLLEGGAESCCAQCVPAQMFTRVQLSCNHAACEAAICWPLVCSQHYWHVSDLPALMCTHVALQFNNLLLLRCG